MQKSPPANSNDSGPRHTRPIGPAHKGHEHLLLAVAYLASTIHVTDPYLTHPVRLQCLKSALALTKEASALLAAVLHMLQPFPPPPPLPIAEPRLPTEEPPP